MGYRAIPTRKKDGKNTLIYVHKVVAELLFPIRKTIPTSFSSTKTKETRRQDNLRWVDKATFKDHMSKYRKSAYTYDKDFTPNNKLTRTQVAVIKKMMNDPNRKTRVKIIAKQFGVSVGTIFSIKRGDSWKHVKAAGSDKSSS